MPTWDANWADVRFDPVAAEEAAAVCERVARVLRDTAGHREASARAALTDGQGPWRDQLERHGQQIGGRVEEIESRLRALATELRDATRRAHAQQHQRIAGRQLWTAEAKVELGLAMRANAQEGPIRTPPS